MLFVALIATCLALAVALSLIFLVLAEAFLPPS